MPKLFFLTLFLVMTPLLAAAPYNYDNVIRDMAPRGKGKEAAREIAAVLEKTTFNVRSDETTEKFTSFLMKTLGKFNFMKLYKSNYLSPLDGGFRGVALQGCSEKESYYYGVTVPGRYRCDLSQIWNFRTLYSLKKNDKPVAGKRSFVFRVNSLTSTSAYSHRNLLYFIDGMLKVIDPYNIQKLGAPESPVFRNLKGHSRIAVNGFYQSFPNISKVLDRMVALRSFISVKKYKGIPYTHQELRYGYRMENMGKDFPQFTRYVLNTKNFFKMVITVKNDRGHVFFTLALDNSNDAFYLSYYTRQGKLIPHDALGKPLFNEAVKLSALKEYSGYGEVGVFFNVHGLKFTTKNIKMRFIYHNIPGEGFFKVKLARAEKTTITGRYYNWIPKWMIDLFIPGDMEQLIFDFFKVMEQADSGKGTSVELRWDTRRRKNIILHFNVVSEFIDSYFLKYGMTVWSKKVRLNKTIVREMDKLAKILITAFRKDLD